MAYRIRKINVNKQVINPWKEIAEERGWVLADYEDRG